MNSYKDLMVVAKRLDFLSEEAYGQTTELLVEIRKMLQKLIIAVEARD
jgi:hypothetical protein